MPTRLCVKLIINGEEKEVSEGLTVEGLLESVSLNQGPVAVEVNEVIIRRLRHREVVLQSGDKVELVTFVGGG